MDECYQFPFLNEEMTKKVVKFRNIKMKNILITNVPYVFIVYELDFYFEDSEIYNAYPIFIYGVFSNLTISNNSFSNSFQINDTYQTSTLYIEYSSNLVIWKNNFSKLYSSSIAPVKNYIYYFV